ncbi:hypothetical protein CHGG_09542 [Chaetomium globosum CBS 148.51]|uniref:L-ornithine N(5)-monooxygenase [NAD(P)H] n=1 Tax=Chaetomium globosum (strain ATCC 6205 / CBS 148.51 / DSM 1962 / NBRC 6347 / NRRL 1970) TaxID=306901 RepID=Q2GR62_CHAGB|nr:uncharacterized protein CHGG_09542 [Chaetomium globosum CBS 148.51]EAQ85528.1 hypothetical protein CHGG_09542 [Chaetomium globosum CBS 148.51]
MSPIAPKSKNSAIMQEMFPSVPCPSFDRRGWESTESMDPGPRSSWFPAVLQRASTTWNTQPSPTAPIIQTQFLNCVNGTANGYSAQDVPNSRYLEPTDANSELDLVCVGFGPASVAIAVALHDSMEAGKMAQAPKVLFLEKQPQFAWHAGMLLPGAKMQISFVKDLASLRDPRSNFTFLNYLHKNNRYAQLVPKILGDKTAPYRVVVVARDRAPPKFTATVNFLFNPEFIDTVYPKSSAYRAHLLEDARATNYGVVRLELIEHLFEVMYHQKRTLGPDEKKWPHRILAGRDIVAVEDSGDSLRLKVATLPIPGAQDGPLLGEEELDVDLVICATGYNRTAHVDMLKDAWHLLPTAMDAENGVLRKDRWLVETRKAENTSTKVMEVGRDYGVRFSPGVVAPGSGVWLQGCCEATHGLSDTLLSVLSTRSGEMVQSIFGASA